jgi:hypothetical protein
MSSPSARSLSAAAPDGNARASLLQRNRRLARPGTSAAIRWCCHGSDEADDLAAIEKFYKS